MPPLPVRGYRACLRLYPVAFRRRFGDEVVDFFHTRYDSARAAGRTGRFLLSAAGDLASSILREHRRAWASRRGGRSAGIRQDAADAWRFARRSPGAAVAIVTLMALTIGAATTVFGVVNVVLLRPLPFRDADRIVSLWERRPDVGIERNVVGAHEFPEWQARATSFAGLAAYVFDSSAPALTGAGDPVALNAVRVTSAFFDVMGAPFALGRGFVADNDLPGHGDVAVISERLWHERLGGTSDVIGRTVSLAGRSVSIVGVVSTAFDFPQGPNGQGPDVWTTIAEPIHLYRGRHYLFLVGRLAPGHTLAGAQEDMNAVTASVAADFPDVSRGHGAVVVPLADELSRTTRPALAFVLGGVLFLVLVGCANIAGLLMAIAVGRRRELAVRLALGASRARLVRQLLAEGLALTVVGGALGLAFAGWLIRVAPAVIPADLLVLRQVPLDGRVLAFSALLSLGTGLLFSVAPAFQAAGTRPWCAVGSSRTETGDAGRRLRGTIVVGQIALTVVLVAGAALMLRSWRALVQVPLGFDPAGVLSVDLALPGVHYEDPVRVRRFVEELTTRLRASPDVASVGTTNLLPLGGGISTVALSVEGQPARRPGDEITAAYRVVGTEYFRTLGIPVRAGRTFSAGDARRALPLIRWYPQQPRPTEADAPQPAPVAIVNETMARTVWAGQNPVGRRFVVLYSPPITVIGVVADAQGRSLREPAGAEFYLSDLQEPQARTNVLVRATDGDALRLGPLVARQVRDIDPDLPLVSVDALATVAGAGIGLPRFTSINVAVFAATALLLMAVGVYGLVSFTTLARTREIGVRIALGADRGRIGRLVLADGLRLGATGVVLGLAATWPLAGLLRAQLFGVQPHDPSILACVAVALLAAAGAATYGPARRAARVDPATSLRADA
jgi:predicted permease